MENQQKKTEQPNGTKDSIYRQDNLRWLLSTGLLYQLRIYVFINPQLCQRYLLSIQKFKKWELWYLHIHISNGKRKIVVMQAATRWFHFRWYLTSNFEYHQERRLYLLSATSKLNLSMFRFAFPTINLLKRNQ